MERVETGLTSLMQGLHDLKKFIESNHRKWKEAWLSFSISVGGKSFLKSEGNLLIVKDGRLVSELNLLGLPFVSLRRPDRWEWLGLVIAGLPKSAECEWRILTGHPSGDNELSIKCNHVATVLSRLGTVPLDVNLSINLLWRDR